MVPFGHNVFRRHQPFFNGRGKTALENNRFRALPHFLQEVEILGVSRADLKHVGVFANEFHLARVHHFGDRRKPGEFFRFRQ